MVVVALLSVVLVGFLIPVSVVLVVYCSSSGEAVITAANSKEETEFTCHIYDGSEGAIRLPEPKAKLAPRKQNVVDGSRDNRSPVNSVASFFNRMCVSLTGIHQNSNTFL